jgi:hypothetical protein
MLGGAAVGLVMLGGAAASGCFDSFADCDLSATCPPPADGGGGGGGSAACEADPTQDPAAVIEDCGVFVSASAEPGGDGTRERPFQSFAEAAAAKPKRVYACAEEYAEISGVSFDGGVEIYAGFTECTGAWTWSATAKATLSGPADAVALTLSDGDNHLENLNVVAANAAAGGGSSIAVVASGGSVAIVNGDLTAGDGMDGAAGATLPQDPMLDGDPGDPGVGVCAAGGNNPGPEGKTKSCDTGGSSVAGKGGDGGPVTAMTLDLAGNGGDGAPADPAQPTKGLGGIGEGQGMPEATECTDGSSGASGAAGDSGAGASGIGSLSATGYAGVNGTAGTNGMPGQGGGGGGGAKGVLNFNCGMGPADRAGASGGAGGTGGCGGNGGGGGRAGGSSIALVVVEAAVTLNGVTLSPGKAGNGGTGGDGQTGGAKGNGGDSALGAGTAKPSCRGGDGGAGGIGGPGGGGQGGHSVGIAFQGSIPPTGGEFSVVAENFGTGGLGGLNNSTPEAGNGTDGIAGNCWDFATNLPCEG